IDVRVVAATHRDLDALVAAGQFRADLLARLGGWTLTLPPLRERLEDLGLLLAGLAPQPSVTLTWEAARALLRYDWPLNVRELETCVTAAVVLSGGAIDVAHLPPALTQSEAPAPPASRQPLSAEDESRRAELEKLLQAESGNVAAVARALGKAPVQIRRWARRYQLDPDQFRR
ncbi:MAG: AAA-type ATPase lid domain-containing protein, partial [Polyangia bacterium]